MIIGVPKETKTDEYRVGSLAVGAELLSYGLVWWFLGPLILMPLFLGMGARLSIEGMSMALPSLWGHLIFGGILGILYPVFAKK